MQTRRGIRKVDGLSPLQGHPFQFAAGRDEGGDIGDGAVDEETGVLPLDIDGLVQITGPHGIHRDKEHVPQIHALIREPVTGSRRLTVQRRWEIPIHPEFLGDGIEVEGCSIKLHALQLFHSPKIRAGRMSRYISRILFPQVWPKPQPRAVNIHLGQSLLTASSSYLQTRRAAFETPAQTHPLECVLMPCSRWGLPGQTSHLACRCALTAPFHPYLRLKTGGGLLSVALSRGSLRVAVNNHRALWSPDFPRLMPG